MKPSLSPAGKLLRALFALFFLLEGGIRACLPAARLSAPCAAGESGEETWPCKDHGCGCTTREKCLTDCCCHKPDRPTGPSRSGDGPAETSPLPGFLETVLRAQACRGLDAGEASISFRPLTIPGAPVPPAAPETVPLSSAPGAKPDLPRPASLFHPPRAA